MNMRDRLRLMASAILVVPAVRLLGMSCGRAAQTDQAVDLNRQGEEFLQEGRYAEAIETFEKMRAVPGLSPYGRGIAAFYLGRARLEVSDFHGAEKHLDDADAIFAQLGKEKERGIVLAVRSRLLAERGELRKSQELSKAAADVLTKQRVESEVSSILITGSAVHSYRSNNDQALECLRIASKLANQAGRKNLIPYIANNSGLAFENLVRHKKALDHYEEALASFRAANDAKGMSIVLNNMGVTFERRSDFRRAWDTYQQSLKLAKTTGDPGCLSLVLNNLGNLHVKKGEYSLALEMYQESYALRNAAGIRHFSAETLNNMGLAKMAFGDYKVAMKCFSEAHGISTEIGIPVCRGWTLHNMAFLRKDMGEPDAALTAAQAAGWIAGNIGDRRMGAATMLRIGNIYEYLGLFDQAQAKFQEALSVSQETGDRYRQSTTLISVATALVRSGSAERAVQHIRRAVEIRQDIGSPAHEALCIASLLFLERPRYLAKGAPGTEKSANLEKAFNELAQAERLVKPEHRHDLMLLTYVKGKCLVEKDPVLAMDQFNQLRSLAEATGSGKYSFLAAFGKCLAHLRRKELHQAQASLRDAADYVQRVKQRLEPQHQETFLSGELIIGVKNRDPMDLLEKIGSGTTPDNLMSIDKYNKG